MVAEDLAMQEARASANYGVELFLYEYSGSAPEWLIPMYAMHFFIRLGFLFTNITYQDLVWRIVDANINEITTAIGSVDTLRPKQNGSHFTDDIFKYIFSDENVWISIKISLKFVPKRSINNIPTLVQIMARRGPGDKPLSEPMMVSLLTHICVTRLQWVKQRINCLAW